MSWKITRDYLAEDENPIWKSQVGYSEDHSRIPLQIAALGLKSDPLPGYGPDLDLDLIPFRLKDDDGEVYYEGELHDDDECENQSAALAWGAADVGCTTIEVKRDGEWVQEIG